MADGTLEVLYMPLYQPATYTVAGTPAGNAPKAAAPQPASPTASASDLQVLIATIPTALDGQVITADYHNGLRQALVAIANRMGLGPVSDEITVTVVPMLRKTSGADEWTSEYGIAVHSGGTTQPVKGWIDVDLPDGARIKKIVAFATATTVTSPATFVIELLRQKITNDTIKLALAKVVVAAGADLSKGVEADVTLPDSGMGITAIEEARVVDNRQHKYLLTAEISDGNNVQGAKITAVQIVLGR